MPLSVLESDRIRNRLANLCQEAKQSVKGGEQYKATMLLRAPHLPDGDVLVTDDDDAEILKAVRRRAGMAPLTVAEEVADAVTAWLEHAPTCEADPCTECDLRFHRVRVTSAMWNARKAAKR